jgi:hypothetical protein
MENYKQSFSSASPERSNQSRLKKEGRHMAIMENQSSTNSMPEIKTNPQNVDELRDWTEEFQRLFNSAVTRYQSGLRGASQIFEAKDVEFLASIGTRPSEIYDFVEDWSEVGEPSLETILAITSIRYDYFVEEQQRMSSEFVQAPETFPAGTLALGDFRWLPRIIAKARAKLKGELPPEIMFSCGTDRPFLKKVGIAPEDFLKTVWEAGPDNNAILARVEEAANRATES